MSGAARAIKSISDEAWEKAFEARFGKPRSIRLEMAEATDEQAMWERRYWRLCDAYPIQRTFSDKDGLWGLRDFLSYAAKAMGYDRA